MALVKQETVTGFQALPALRQIGLMIGLAASVALGVAVVLWSQEPNYTVLYAGLSNKDAGLVVDALTKKNIPFQVDQATGAVMVASERIHDARMELAREGLPEGNAIGFEMLQKEQGFGTSQFIETKRYQHALEGELSRTISTLRNVEKARVHLAIPKRSVFLRDRADPTASVMLDLYSGRSLDEDQVAAIVHLVSSSVPHLRPEKVTVVDQRGRLLSNGAAEAGMAASSSQLSYRRKLETTYVERIRKLLEPLVGEGKVRATVNADLDFTVTERTEESYNPDLAALRSEQVTEDNSTEGDAASGVPGALSNQPPAQAGLQPAGQDNNAEAARNTRSSKRRVRNYELDKTISHTRLATGTVRRLSIAVVIDNKQELDENDEPQVKPWSDAELARFTALVKESVGFDARRGDSVNVVNSSFVPPPEPEEVPAPSLLEQPWVWSLAKQAAGAIGLLLVVFGVLKPVMRSLAEKGAETAAVQQAALAAGAGAEGGEAGQAALPGGHVQQPQLAGPAGGNEYEQHLETAKSVVSDDPKRVAQVVKNWVNEDG
ncbi:MAG TPA: flagellar basal body M-ring protein FliF [Gammaproteobacteria bacterium]|nr:flagellar basal body M-ring protein FliF [Gammaproteobacteria bacterium]